MQHFGREYSFPYPVSLTDSGETVCWPGGEHAIVICAYDDTSLTYRDPNSGTTVEIDYPTFEKGFSEMGGRIIYYEKAQAPAGRRR